MSIQEKIAELQAIESLMRMIEGRIEDGKEAIEYLNDRIENHNETWRDDNLMMEAKKQQILIEIQKMLKKKAGI